MSRENVIGIALIDPPPLQSMIFTEGKLNILSRYCEPLLSTYAYR